MTEKEYVDDVYDAEGNLVEPGYTAWDCDCGERIYRFRGDGDVKCSEGHWWNSFGQRLRDDWQGNPAWKYDDCSDMEGFERQQLSQERDE